MCKNRWISCLPSLMVIFSVPAVSSRRDSVPPFLPFPSWLLYTNRMDSRETQHKLDINNHLTSWHPSKSEVKVRRSSHVTVSWMAGIISTHTCACYLEKAGWMQRTWMTRLFMFFAIRLTGIWIRSLIGVYSTLSIYVYFVLIQTPVIWPCWD